MSRTGQIGVRRRWRRRFVGSGLALVATGLLLAACGEVPRPTGELEVRTDGLPEGTGPRITITDDAGFEHSLTGSAAVLLDPGRYTVRANSVTVDGDIYTPTEASRATEVSAGVSAVVEFMFLKATDEVPVATDSAASPTPARTPLLRGVLWEDLDGDGTFDGSERALPGVTIFLDLDDDGRLDDGEPRTVTSRIGSYRFEGLEPGRTDALALQQATSKPNIVSTAAHSDRIAHYQW